MLKGILSIAGQSGLYKLVSRGNNALIVESLADGKRTSAATSQRISALADITMYTQEGDKKLSEVMAGIFAITEGKAVIDAKKAATDALKAEMNRVFPEWDSERIYTSDIKKLFTWYNLLLCSGIITAEAIEEAKKEEEAQEAE